MVNFWTIKKSFGPRLIVKGLSDLCLIVIRRCENGD
jgi:hypothetical protein